MQTDLLGRRVRWGDEADQAGSVRAVHFDGYEVTLLVMLDDGRLVTVFQGSTKATGLEADALGETAFLEWHDTGEGLELRKVTHGEQLKRVREAREAAARRSRDVSGVVPFRCVPSPTDDGGAA
jgi:hypothetical protein